MPPSKKLIGEFDPSPPIPRDIAPCKFITVPDGNGPLYTVIKLPCVASPVLIVRVPVEESYFAMIVKYCDVGVGPYRQFPTSKSTPTHGPDPVPTVHMPVPKEYDTPNI
jgi:hypothetical protein